MGTLKALDQYRKLLKEDPDKAAAFRGVAEKKNPRFASLIELYDTLVPAIIARK